MSNSNAVYWNSSSILILATNTGNNRIMILVFSIGVNHRVFRSGDRENFLGDRHGQLHLLGIGKFTLEIDYTQALR